MSSKLKQLSLMYVLTSYFLNPISLRSCLVGAYIWCFKQSFYSLITMERSMLLPLIAMVSCITILSSIACSIKTIGILIATNEALFYTDDLILSLILFSLSILRTSGSIDMKPLLFNTQSSSSVSSIKVEIEPHYVQIRFIELIVLNWSIISPLAKAICCLIGNEQPHLGLDTFSH